MTLETSSRGIPGDSKPTQLGGLNTLFRALIYLALILSVVDVIMPLINPEAALTLETKDGLVHLKAAELPTTDRLTMVGLTMLPSLFWIAGLVFLERLSRRHFATGDVFSIGSTQCVSFFGLALVGTAIADPLTYPIAGHYLFQRGLILAEMQWNWSILIDSVDLIVAAVFLFLMGKIMGRAIALSEEAKLTV